MPQVPTITVILNAAAGTAKARPNIAGEIRDLFRAAGRDAEVIALQPGQSPAEAVRNVNSASIVVAAGGDGTVSGVVAGILGSPATLGVLPLGTLNHFAKDLQIPLDLAEAIAVVAAGHVQRVDVGSVNDRPFVNNSSIGIYPGIVEAREELQHEHGKWTAMAIATLRVLRQYSGLTVRIEADGQLRDWRTTPFVFAGNNEYAIDGLHIGERARLDSGKLFVYLAPRTRTRDLPLLVVKALVGRASQSGAFEIVPAAELRIQTRRATSIRVAMDGEVVTMRTPLLYRVRPGALPVVRPRTPVKV